ncbi:DNA phosphorothioation system sulfurtransferase DndC [Caballeronia sp. LZ043]|uniref:DNA phosphorothioation system sulfurtransferase DndC n=1 Tax=Caballeronia sp. LZ043 TaxID=3038569 RepID=UPI0028554054|nr:DNA phosphorothioation system sulfurtransferase DndC [Caballeronia sp. LZ043]MDR5819143.1 DNA phosphorothioation system sulfurtransferase DndC [Caballeronia sp. LZ043]
MNKIFQVGDEHHSIEELWERVIWDIRSEYLSPAQDFPWIIGFSGGKDSTLVAHLAFEALLTIPPSQRTRPVHVVSNDTLVESPFVMLHLNKVCKKIAASANDLGLPVVVARTQPPLDKTFWTLLIGKGYPSPNQSMRWCTDRLKIMPTSAYIKNNISEFGAAIVVLGVRRLESSTRQRVVDGYKNQANSRLHEHSELKGAYIYRPIVDLSTDEVWEALGTFDAPWGGSHSDLFTLYREAEGGECPVVLSSEEAPGCGTPNSRFGCWTCTVVEKDKSLQGYVDSGHHRYLPLIRFRDWLRTNRNDPAKRQVLRRNGRLTFGTDGRHIPGPFTVKARMEILERLLETQRVFGETLISMDEIDLIHQIWAEELRQQRGVADGTH